MSIGIGILSTDRIECTKRLLESIKKYTSKDINVHIFDDSSEKKFEVHKLIKKYKYEFNNTGKRIGIAKNSNMLLKRLEEYDYKVMLNNDVEILKKGWIDSYIDAIEKTSIHCFTHRQLGLWGACKDGENNKRPDIRSEVNGVKIATVQSEPQGAIMIFDKLAHESVGYYDSKTFNGYGRSHHLWCICMGLSGIQPEGFHDIHNSNEYIKTHNVKSITQFKKRISDYMRNKQLYKEVINNIKNKKRKVYTPFI